MRINNKKVVEAMVNNILKNLCFSDYKRYIDTFKNEIDYNIYSYGNLDIYYHELYEFLKKAGYTGKAVKDYEKLQELNDSNFDALERAYKNLIRFACSEINEKLRRAEITRDNFKQY